MLIHQDTEQVLAGFVVWPLFLVVLQRLEDDKLVGDKCMALVLDMYPFLFPDVVC